MRSPIARARKMWMLIGVVCLSTAAGWLVGGSVHRSIPGRGSSTTRDPGGAGVIDGDTLRISVPGGQERVRLIGINSPEVGECMADEARHRLEDLVAGGPLRLETDVSDRDRYGRLLRYVYSGDTFVNLTMVSEGLAVSSRHAPDVSRSDQLGSAEAEARAAGRGIWRPAACHASATGVVIGETRFDGTDGEGEYVDVVNRSSRPVDLGGWELRDGSAGHRFGFVAGFDLSPGAAVRVHSGCGEPTTTDLYWCAGSVWNDDGDTAFLVDAGGGIVDHWSG